LLKSDVVCQSYGNVYSVIVFLVDTVYICDKENRISLDESKLTRQFVETRFESHIFGDIVMTIVPQSGVVTYDTRTNFMDATVKQEQKTNNAKSELGY